MSEEELIQFNTVQRAWMLAPFNVWVTGVATGHKPSEQEAGLHFVVEGGAEAFRKWWQDLSPKDKAAAYEKATNDLKEVAVA